MCPNANSHYIKWVRGKKYFPGRIAESTCIQGGAGGENKMGSLDGLWPPTYPSLSTLPFLNHAAPIVLQSLSLGHIKSPVGVD